ncbi:hypothetical protein DDE19_29430 [Micromonospora ureilytica]|uniref:Uncharacterized protein n=1 Tax=Micromonospora ureilytica TaxID=709868 RepID=A0A3N9XGJ8_9ACTN|nr:hypothetical protein [Micromonospora ureilytica]RQX12078.1 hypothetical protein DDE19_29430 [Micromonospora ureilytica]
MGLADFIRIARGNLTPEELAERDAAARARREQREAEAARQAADADAITAQEVALATDRQRHPWRMETAVGIGSVELVCHADTLDRLLVMLDRTIGWRNPKQDEGRVEKLDGHMVRVLLSGQQVSLILFRTKERAANAWAGEAALARRFYRAFASVVDQVDPDAPVAAALPPVLLDDRVSAPARDDEVPPSNQ